MAKRASPGFRADALVPWRVDLYGPHYRGTSMGWVNSHTSKNLAKNTVP